MSEQRKYRSWTAQQKIEIVIYRKLSLGSQSTGGERRIERLLSAHTTSRLWPLNCRGGV